MSLRQCFATVLLSSLGLSLGMGRLGEDAIAQSLVLDGTLGPSGPLNGPIYFVEQALGQTVDDNLFHSFEQFNLSRGELAFFASGADVRNIFTRVTGGASSIDGILFAPDVNFFLLNPSGVLFGPNARISVGQTTSGSFTVSTFDSLAWDNGGQFNARLPEATAPLLTLSGNPSRFMTGTGIPGDIGFQDSNIALAEEQSLLLLGGNIVLNGSQLSLPDGQVQFTAAQQGPVPLRFIDQQPQLGLPIASAIHSTPFSRISLEESSVDVSGPFSGRVDFHGASIELDASSVDAGVTQGGIVTDDAAQTEGPGIRFRAGEQVLLHNSSSVGTLLEAGAVGSSGLLEIETGLLSLQTGSALGTAIAFGNGRSGDIKVVAEEVELGPGSSIVSSLTGFGESGDINISAQSLQISEGVLSSIVLLGFGQAGDINLDISGPIEIRGNGIASNGSILNVVVLGEGQAGDININSGSLRLGQGGQIGNSVFVGSGAAGDINLTTERDLILDGESREQNASAMISSSVFSGLGLGTGGNITLKSGNAVQLLNGALVQSRSTGTDRAGDITVEAVQDIVLSESSVIDTAASDLGDAGNVSLVSSQGDVLLSNQGVIGSSVENPNSRARGGDILIQAENIRLRDRSALISLSYGQAGQAGAVSLLAADSIDLNNAFISANSFGGADSGEVSLFADNSITFSNTSGIINGILTARSLAIAFDEQGEALLDAAEDISISDLELLRSLPEGAGFAEELSIVADAVTVDDSFIASFSIAANGGNIQLEASDYLLLRNGGRISAGTELDTSTTAGNGGGISIDTPFIIAIPEENSDISTDAVNGIGGDISITTQGLFGIEFRPKETPLSDITASSEFGLDGTFTLDTPGLNPAQDLSELPTDLIDPSQQIAQRCARTANRSSFINTGRNGIPLTPTDAQTLSNTEADWAALPPATAIAQAQVSPTEPAAAPTEVTHWQRDPEGNIVLLATQPVRPTFDLAHC